MRNKGFAVSYFIPTQKQGGSRAQVQAVPSVIITQEPAGCSAHGTAPPGERREKLYSTAVGKITQHQHFKVIVKSNDKLSAETVKGLPKSEINPTDINLGINSFKALTDGKEKIKKNLEEAEALENDNKNKCGEELETIFHRRRNLRIFMRNIPEDVTTINIGGTLIKPNTDLNL